MRTDLNQLDFHLQRRIAEKAGQLGFGGDFGGHQIQNADAQRTDILCGSPQLVHDKNVFAFKYAGGRERLWYFNRHWGNLRNFILLHYTTAYPFFQ